MNSHIMAYVYVAFSVLLGCSVCLAFLLHLLRLLLLLLLLPLSPLIVTPNQRSTFPFKWAGLDVNFVPMVVFAFYFFLADC